jgi:hypothetical protein
LGIDRKRISLQPDEKRNRLCTEASRGCFGKADTFLRGNWGREEFGMADHAARLLTGGMIHRESPPPPPHRICGVRYLWGIANIPAGLFLCSSFFIITVILYEK